jgi:hypothetical protein
MGARPTAASRETMKAACTRLAGLVGLLLAGRAPEIWAGGVTIFDGAPTKTPKPQLRG